MTSIDPYYRPWPPLVAAHSLVKGSLMVIAPHPDDEIVGGGGLVCAHRDAGEAVDVVVMTDGGLGNPGGEGGPEYVALRKEETHRALELLGGAEHHFLGYPDGGLSSTWQPVEDLVRMLERHAPKTLLFPSPFEIHPDHRATALMVARAVRALPEPPALYAYEVGATLCSNVLVDITPFMLRKEEALRAFPSQLLHQDLVGKVRALNHARTVNVDDPAVRYVEAYAHIQTHKVDEYFGEVESLLRRTHSMSPL